MEAQRYVGLTEKEVAASRERYGANVLTPPEKDSLWKRFLERLTGPFGHHIEGWEDGDGLIFILEIAALLSIFISCAEFFGWFGLEPKGYGVFFEPLGILIAIALATGIAFYFELKADKEFTLLVKEDDEERFQVIRDGRITTVPKTDIVVGDIVVLETGMEIPADGKLLEAVSLRVDESSLTGEPEHRKSANANDFAGHTYPSNHVHRGTQVKEGHGLMEVFAVGDRTENGKIMQSLVGVNVDDGDDYDEAADESLSDEQRRALALKKKTEIGKDVRTPLNEQLDGLGDLITNVSYGFAAAIIVAKLLMFFGWAAPAWSLLIPVVVFCYAVIKKFGDWSMKACILATVGFFVVFIGMVLVLRYMTDLQTDEASLLTYTLGTLMIAVTLIVVAVPEGLPMAVNLSLAYSMRSMLKTNNLVRKMHACETMGAVSVICTDKTGTLTQNAMRVADTYFPNATTPGAQRIVAESFAVNSTAQLQEGDGGAEPTVLGNPTEGALLLYLRQKGLHYLELRAAARRVDEVPFSTERKYMATLVENAEGKRTLYLKGAPEVVMDLCGSSFDRDEVKRRLADFQSRGMRTLGFAYCPLSASAEAIADGQLRARDFRFLGIVAIADPVRDDVPAAVKECRDAGINIKIVTGDTVGTTKEVARRIGLWDDATDGDDAIIEGSDFAALSDDELAGRLNSLKIVARARPMDKKRLVEALIAQGQVVAVTGDGTNDAPALKAAHVGLSMGDGTKVAKEASDITIIDNSFASIGRAVMWGRSLYKNIQRFLLFQLTVNVAACFIVLVGAFVGKQSPLTVTQMLWVNLIMDTFAAMALASLPPSERVMREKPRPRGQKGQSLVETMHSGAFIIDRSMAWNIFGVGGFFFLLLLGFLYVFQHADITSLSDLLHVQFVSYSEVTPYELSLFFTIFVMTHFWYMFNARAYKTGGSGLNLKGCKGFITIAILIFVGQIVIVECLYNFFDVTPLKLSDWVIIVALSSLVMIVREVWALIKRSIGK